MSDAILALQRVAEAAEARPTGDAQLQVRDFRAIRSLRLCPFVVACSLFLLLRC